MAEDNQTPRLAGFTVRPAVDETPAGPSDLYKIQSRYRHDFSKDDEALLRIMEIQQAFREAADYTKPMIMLARERGRQAPDREDGNEDEESRERRHRARIGALDQEIRKRKEHGDIEARDIFGRTALVTAARNNDADLVTALARNGAKIQDDGDKPFNALNEAALTGSPASLKALIAAGADIHAGNDEALRAAAVAVNGTDCIEELLRRGARIGAVNEYGETALRRAAAVGRTANVETLIAHGADVNDGALVEAAGMFRDEGDPLPQAGMLPYTGDATSCVRALLDHGADVNKRNRDGHTALIEAAEVKQVGALNLLLAHGADVNAKDPDGQTALMHAVAGQLGVDDASKAACVQALAAHGADLNAADKDGQTALMAAVDARNANAVRILLEHGADPNILDKNGHSALSLAARDGNAEVARLLVEYGARNAATVDVNARDDAGGWTPLMWAVNTNRPDAVRLLLAHGGDPTIVLNDYGDSALRTANLNPDPNDEIQRLMREYAANGHSGGQKTTKLSPSEFARMAGHEDLARLIECGFKPSAAQKRDETVAVIETGGEKLLMDEETLSEKIEELKGGGAASADLDVYRKALEGLHERAAQGAPFGPAPEAGKDSGAAPAPSLDGRQLSAPGYKPR